MYALWLAAPVIALAALIPARTVTVTVSPLMASAPVGMSMNPTPFDLSALLLVIWLSGAAASALAVAWRQQRFVARFAVGKRSRLVVRTGSHLGGPAVVGLLEPRILLPADFVSRFDPLQRRVVLAHEAVHLARGDSRINAAVLLLQCLGWFNPAVHLAARAMRLDQELSCDAVVMSKFPKARRAYAEAMLKSQLGALALPIGCHWPARGPSALSCRLSLLHAAPPPRSRVLAGLVAGGLVAALAGAGVWSAQPPRTRLVVMAAPQIAAFQPSPAAHQAVAATTARRFPARRIPPMSAPSEPELSQTEPSAAVPAARRIPQRSFDGWFSMPMSPEDVAAGPQVARLEAGEPQAPAGGMTSQGSVGGSHAYRNGVYQMVSNVTAVGDTVEVLAKLYQNGAEIGAGKAITTPGETAYVALSNGQVATLAPGQTAYIITRQPLIDARAPAPS